MMKTLRVICLLAFGAFMVPVAALAQSYSGGGFDALRGGNAHSICRGEALALYQRYTEVLQIIERIANCNKDGQVYKEVEGCTDTTLSPDHVFTLSDTGASLAFYNADGTLAAAAIVGGAKGADVACVEVADPEDPTHCEAPWGSTVVDGGSVYAYQTASVPAGETCRNQLRTCTAGTLSGSYTFRTCTIEEEEVVDPEPPVMNSCTAPWGATVAHGLSITAYYVPTVPYATTCAYETRRCNNGTLSGSYQYGSCTPESDPCTACYAHCGSATGVSTYGGSGQCVSQLCCPLGCCG